MDPATFTPAHRGGEGPPLVCVHGFTDTWRTWELALGRLEQSYDVLAPTLAGHAGGPPLPARPTDATLVESVEAAMDDAGMGTAHVAGNSLGGDVALQLAERGRARSVVVFAPAGGFAADDDSHLQTLAYFEETHAALQQAAAHVDAIAASKRGRRRATEMITVRYEHIPAALIAHQLLGAARCPGFEQLLALARTRGWPRDASAISCPVRIVWGLADRVLPWPAAGAAYQRDLAAADWVLLDHVGHCPQLDVPLEAAQLILGISPG
jgi:pimeloyl-ACP methyl ester carboxylesterase